MTRPTFRMVSSTDPADHSCIVTINVDSTDIEISTTTRVGHLIREAVDRAYDEGCYDGRRAVIGDTRRFMEALRCRDQ